MRNFTLLLFASLLSFSTIFAQEAIPKKAPLELSIFGGPSLPLGDYKGDIGRAKNGINAGLSLDYFFGNSNWGIGLDGRYQQHKMRSFITDSGATNSLVYGFGNGFTQFSQVDDAFKHIGISLGPVYRVDAGPVAIRAFVRAGALFQKYPSYTQSIWAQNPFTNQLENVLTPFQTDNQDAPIALMGLAGLRVVYKITPKIGIGLQADYLRAFGDKGEFSVLSNEKKREIDNIRFEREDKDNVYTTNITDFYSTEKTRKSAPIQDFNVGLSIQFSFGGSGENRERGGKGKVNATVAVKDKLTGLALGGVKVEIMNAKGRGHTLITDANGIVKTELKTGDYIINGSKNNVSTSSANIIPSEFKNGDIYKEIYLNDERFTLSGETYDCETGNNLGGISTQLTRISDGQVVDQTSDGKGQFYFQLDKNSDYQIVAIEDGKYSQTELVTTKGLNRAKQLYVKLKLGVCNLSAGTEFEVKNILYDFDKSNIRSDAALVLNNIAHLLKQNPKMTIELSSHTDSRGDNAYNKTLSQERANAAVDYLVSKGIARKRMSAHGYGETKIKNKCKDGVNCSEAQHQENRRTEVKILTY